MTRSLLVLVLAIWCHGEQERWRIGLQEQIEERTR